MASVSDFTADFYYTSNNVFVWVNCCWHNT